MCYSNRLRRLLEGDVPKKLQKLGFQEKLNRILGWTGNSRPVLESTKMPVSECEHNFRGQDVVVLGLSKKGLRGLSLGAKAD